LHIAFTREIVEANEKFFNSQVSNLCGYWDKNPNTNMVT